MEVGFLRVNTWLFSKAGLRSVVASTWGGKATGLGSSVPGAVSLQLWIGRIAVWWLERTRFAGGWVPSVRCSRVVAAAPSTIAILVFQRGLGWRYTRGER